MIDKYTNKKLTPAQKRFAEDMQQNRGLDFVRIGLQVEVDGNIGIIKGMNSSANLNVAFEGERDTSNFHPTWETRYFDFNNDIIKDYREKQT